MRKILLLFALFGAACDARLPRCVEGAKVIVSGATGWDAVFTCAPPARVITEPVNNGTLVRCVCSPDWPRLRTVPDAGAR